MAMMTMTMMVMMAMEHWSSGVLCVVLLHNASHCIVLHCTALHCIVLHCTAPFCITLHRTASHCVILHRTASYCAVLHYKTSWCALPSVAPQTKEIPRPGVNVLAGLGPLTPTFPARESLSIGGLSSGRAIRSHSLTHPPTAGVGTS